MKQNKQQWNNIRHSKSGISFALGKDWLGPRSHWHLQVRRLHSCLSQSLLLLCSATSPALMCIRVGSLGLSIINKCTESVFYSQHPAGCLSGVSSLDVQFSLPLNFRTWCVPSMASPDPLHLPVTPTVLNYLQLPKQPLPVPITVLHRAFPAAPCKSHSSLKTSAASFPWSDPHPTLPPSTQIIWSTLLTFRVGSSLLDWAPGRRISICSLLNFQSQAQSRIQ